MNKIYHIVSKHDWQQKDTNEPYVHPSLDAEGFIHCSYQSQVVTIANLFYAEEEALLLLHIDADQLGDLLREEVAQLPVDVEGIPEEQGPFPHVYGPIEPKAIVEVQEMKRDEKGRWTL